MAALAVSLSVAQAQQTVIVPPPVALPIAPSNNYDAFSGAFVGTTFLPGFTDPMGLYFSGTLPIGSGSSVNVFGVPGNSAQFAGNVFSPSGFFTPYGAYMPDGASMSNGAPAGSGFQGAYNLNSGPVVVGRSNPYGSQQPNGVQRNGTVDPATQSDTAHGAVNGNAENAPAATARLSPVLVHRTANGRVDLTYRGDTTNVTRITMMLLDASHRELTRQVITEPPAKARLLRLRGSKYYRIRLEYPNGTARSYTGLL